MVVRDLSHHCATISHAPSLDDSGSFEVKGPEAPCGRFCYIQSIFLRRKPDAIRSFHRKDDLLNGIAIDSPQASSRLLTEFTRAEEFTIELQDGEVIEVDSGQLAQMLGE